MSRRARPRTAPSSASQLSKPVHSAVVDEKKFQAVLEASHCDLVMDPGKTIVLNNGNFANHTAPFNKAYFCKDNGMYIITNE